MNDLKKLKIAAKNFSVLYAEDNKALRVNATKLLKKIFDNVDNASDGEEALVLLKEKPIDILLTDIKMPKMDGLELAKNVKNTSPETKVIVMSAFDEAEYLMDAIKVGVFRFLKKPVNVNELTDVLYDALFELKNEQTTKLFYTHLKHTFNYQSSMVIMLNEMKPVLANQVFLDFFDVIDVEEFRNKYEDIGALFLEHNGFLYNHDGLVWSDIVRLDENKLFHVKVKNDKGSVRHLTFKYQSIPEKAGYGILSFDDITEFQLLKIFDTEQTLEDTKSAENKAMLDLLTVIKRNNTKVEAHNYYKGLSITNDALIVDVQEDTIKLKTTYMQQKAILYEKKTIIISESLPKSICCEIVGEMNFEEQSVDLKGLRFIETSPIARKTIRIVPEENSNVVLFIGANKFDGKVFIEDISLDSVKLGLEALPPGLEKGSEVTLDITLEFGKTPLSFNTKATLFRKSESKHSFSIVFMFVDLKKNELLKYITKRQMAIIREFKGLQNG